MCSFIPLASTLKYYAFGSITLSLSLDILSEFWAKKTTPRKIVGWYKLATTYSHTAFRRTTIGATVFHFQVRNGTGWFHCAMITRFLRSWMLLHSNFAAYLGILSPYQIAIG